jgi:hypothetical protein
MKEALSRSRQVSLSFSECRGVVRSSVWRRQSKVSLTVVGMADEAVRQARPGSASGRSLNLKRVSAGVALSGYLVDGAAVDDCPELLGGACLLGGAGASGQSGSALSASQSAAEVRPPRASAIVTEDINATNARAAVSLRMNFSPCSAH